MTNHETSSMGNLDGTPPISKILSEKHRLGRERCGYLVQPLDERVVVVPAALDHAREGVAEPLPELPVRLEHVGHEEVHQRPQLHQVVLERGAGQQQTVGGLEVQQHLPPLGLEVLDVLGLYIWRDRNQICGWCNKDISQIYFPQKI